MKSAEPYIELEIGRSDRLIPGRRRITGNIREHDFVVDFSDGDPVDAVVVEKLSRITDPGCRETFQVVHVQVLAMNEMDDLLIQRMSRLLAGLVNLPESQVFV